MLFDIVLTFYFVYAILYLSNYEKVVYIMATKRATLNPITDTPTNKSYITKDFMLCYMEKVADKSGKEWFKALVFDNMIEKKNSLTGENTTTPNWKVIKNAFIEKYFPNLNKAKNKIDFIDRIKNL